MATEEKSKIKSFRDLEVYRNSYAAMLTVAEELLIKLPENERFDLKDQLSRSSKAIPRLISEGYAKSINALVLGSISMMQWQNATKPS